jgi:hypothetical protein
MATIFRLVDQTGAELPTYDPLTIAVASGDPFLCELLSELSRLAIDADTAAYRPATDFVDAQHPNYKSIRSALAKNPWVRNRRPLSPVTGRPDPHRLLLHAADWVKYLTMSRSSRADPHDMNAGVVDAIVLEVEQRKAEERRRKAGD